MTTRISDVLAFGTHDPSDVLNMTFYELIARMDQTKLAEIAGYALAGMMQSDRLDFLDQALAEDDKARLVAHWIDEDDEGESNDESDKHMGGPRTNKPAPKGKKRL